METTHFWTRHAEYFEWIKLCFEPFDKEAENLIYQLNNQLLV